ncbi:MAG TPA: D-alanine--D-alanine ligase [Candidatus Saccharimonadales bacterium]
MSKPNIAVIFGSRSAEHDVSIVTAIVSIINPLELTDKYNVVPVYIAKNGAWYSSPKLKNIDLYSSGNLESFLNKIKPLAVSFNNGMTLIQSGFKSKELKIDLVFPATHGTYGEDGALMGLLDMANVAYVGCDQTAATICMDKVLARDAVSKANVKMNRYDWFYANDFEKNQSAVLGSLQTLNYPLFVKPVHLGSSIAISKVSNKQELINAIEVAIFYDSKVIVEEAVNNLVEVTIPLIGNDEIIAANTEEPNQGDKFFDFDTKYMRQGKSKANSSAKGAHGYSHIPARISDEMKAQSISIAKQVYRTIGCSGVARVDLLIDSKTNDIYFNEINPLPGSLFAHNWKTVGISNVELVEKLIDYANQRYQQKQKLNTTFSTNFLKQF